MITVTTVLQQIRGLDEQTLRRWIAQDWVRPARRGENPVFEEIDIARLHLILELRDQMEVGETAMPVVLSLLDQLHASRRHMRRLCEMLDAAGPEDKVHDILGRLGGR
ncbi:chaperone modulator CbpM [Roseomonas gilardii]|uniref:Chaperone modulator CbpM n=1 Tax=Roseomonas gilardii TaxID=257708 RepID=A0ABU3MGD4_9PROT|nr:MerR family transcriptional regulator [Roseomonas gilardii]MDT8332029.1 chaperone modulator CbpM [Roseomonas gilardii]